MNHYQNITFINKNSGTNRHSHFRQIYGIKNDSIVFKIKHAEEVIIISNFIIKIVKHQNYEIGMGAKKDLQNNLRFPSLVVSQIKWIYHSTFYFVGNYIMALFKDVQYN